MKYNHLVYVLIIGSILILFITPTFSQEGQAPATKAPTPTGSAKEEAPRPEEISIYGEVQSVNPSLNFTTVQYYDYDSDEEKTIEILSDKDTRIENAASLNDVKQGDWVDVTYSVSDGKNIAKSIMVEKEEELPKETTPEKAP